MLKSQPVEGIQVYVILLGAGKRLCASTRPPKSILYEKDFKREEEKRCENVMEGKYWY